VLLTVVIAVPVVSSVVVLFTEIAISVAIPVVVMFNPAPTSFPETSKIPLPFIVRHYPASPRIRWTSPVTVMPLVMLPHRIPITLYPKELRGWPWR